MSLDGFSVLVGLVIGGLMMAIGVLVGRRGTGTNGTDRTDGTYLADGSRVPDRSRLSPRFHRWLRERNERLAEGTEAGPEAEDLDEEDLESERVRARMREVEEQAERENTGKAEDGYLRHVERVQSLECRV